MSAARHGFKSVGRPLDAFCAPEAYNLINPMPQPDRFVDTREVLLDFAGECLVVCPACEACARVVPKDAREGRWSGARRLVCVSCGLIRETGAARGGQDGEDPFFGLPLWLRAPCCGETLWAYNRRHLELLRAFLGAKLREQERDPEFGWSNRSLTNRLPGWMKSAQNRSEVVRVIEKLFEKLDWKAEGKD